MTEIKKRGVKDIFITCVDGLKGFPEAIEATFPKTEVQLCVVHMIRNSLRYVSWKDRKALASDLKGVIRRGGQGKPCGLCQQVGRPLSDDLQILAGQLAAGHSVFFLSRGDPQDHLHDQCY
jgi:hypothetical protein